MRTLVRNHSLLAALGVLTAVPPAPAQDRAMFVNRTVFLDDGSDVTSISQKGGAILSPSFEEGVARTVGFWMRRRSDGDHIVQEEEGDRAFAFLTRDGNSSGVYNVPVPSSHLGESTSDTTWDYFYAKVFANGDYEVFRNGVSIQTGPDDGFLEPVLDDNRALMGSALWGPLFFFIGNPEDQGLSAFGALKEATNFSFALDDFSVWEGTSAEVEQIHQNIVKYGMAAFDEEHPDLVAYYNCNSAAQALNYYEDFNIIISGVNSPLFGSEKVAPILAEVSAKPVRKIPVTIVSDYGADLVAPPVSASGDFDFGTAQEFSAPVGVYLDRYGNELGADLAAVRDFAYYRATLDGYSLNGAEAVTNSNSVTVVLDEIGSEAQGVTIKWFWRVDYAVDIRSGAEGVEGLNGGVLGADPKFGLGFAEKNDGVEPAVNGSADASGGVRSDIEFQLTGYVAENLPGQTDRSVALTNGNDFLFCPDIGTDLTTGGGDGSFTVDFWARRDPVAAGGDQNVVAIGSTDADPTQIRVGFRRNDTGQLNQFFLANNQGGTEAEPRFTDGDWHHWAAVSDRPAGKIYLYRDGELVREHDRVFNFDGNTVMTVGLRAQNAAGTSVSNPVQGTVNNVRVWNVVRTQAQVQESMVTTAYGPAAPPPGLAVELTFDAVDRSGDPWVVTSTEGNGLAFEFRNINPLFPATVTDDAVKEAALFPGFTFVPFAETPDMVSAGQYFVRDWSRVTYRWKKRYLVELASADLSGEAVYDPDVLPYVYGAAAFEGTGSAWVDDLAVLTVGTRYRTDDRCFTFAGIANGAGSGGLSGAADGTLVDATFGGNPAREYAINGITGPGVITFNFDRTTFRAEVPLGGGLDVSSLASLNAQLVPDLCVGGLLRTNDEPPTEVEAVVADGVGNGGENVLWDPVGQQLLPLRPGRFTVAWPDADDPATIYTIEVVAGFPGDTDPVAYDIEGDDGFRLGGPAGPFVNEVAFPVVAAPFPGNPAAHYRTVFHPDPNKNPPVELDPGPADRWWFHKQTYTETDSAADEVDKSFIPNGVGRSVLLFSYRPDPAAVASGDASREAFAVRVVETFTAADKTVAGGAGEVATRLTSAADTAGFGSGYILNELSNYNPQIYTREAGVGEWGAIYPTNWSGLFAAADVDVLDVAYYENPFGDDPEGLVALHPNVAWPYTVTRYDNVTFPLTGDHADKRIYIASRLGTEGVDAAGEAQLIFDPAAYAELAVYHQPDRTEPGYNPNEEHALVAPSILDQLTGVPSANIDAEAAFALQHQLNIVDQGDPDTYTSEPWALVQYLDIEADELVMAAYKVEEKRAGAALFPATDPGTHLPTDALGQPVAQPADPEYDFEYNVFAGDPLVPPYPLNRVIGNAVLTQQSGGQLSAQRVLWQDIDRRYWVAAGDIPLADGMAADDDGEFYFQYYYPFRADFWYDLDDDGANDIGVGRPVAFLPENGAFLPDSSPQPQLVRYQSWWRANYPQLKRGETVTYAGGEHFNETPGAAGLPGIIGFAAAQVIYDDRSAFMVYSESNIDSYTARIIRPLERIEVDMAQADLPEELTPAFTDNVLVVSERWYFRALVGSLQKRFYYDSLRAKLVFRGRVNDREGGDPDLTAAPVSLSVLEPNILTFSEFGELVALGGGDSAWEEAVEEIFLTSQDPQGTGLAVDDSAQAFYAGMEPSAGAFVSQPLYYTYDAGSDTVTELDIPTAFGVLDVYQPMSSLGAGAALVPNPDLLYFNNLTPFYLTVAENNHPDAAGAISLHVIRLSDDRFRGAVKVIEAADVFDEKINLQHTGDFAANTRRMYYQWWVRDAAGLDDVGLPGSVADGANWQIFTQGLGLHKIAFTGRPDVVLSDKLFFCRYAPRSELEWSGYPDNVLSTDPEVATVSEDSWRLVGFEIDTYRPYGTGNPSGFQWAGAANSPQPQADGSRRYLPQLVMGWVKRVLDRINPYEARFTDFLNNESPATYASMLQIAGPPFNGKVALNADKDVIENTGLIQLYETVLARAIELTLPVQGAATAGTNQAVLLASTRLAVLYELLAREAYSDAQDPTIAVTDEGGLQNVAAYTHAFADQEASVLHEGLALLRGTDFIKAFPADNRLFWNYVKGLGEAAYNATYNIHDENGDGFINEFDAAALYPQGHGDAWGHFLSAARKHYDLLNDPNGAFSWEAKAELYSLLDNVIEADYLDEKTFARIAVAKARTGLEVLRETYRLAFTEDPAGQWQGYADIDPARAWGVAGWAKRTGQAAYFDWLVGNALVPEAAGDEENLDRIDRRANRAELGEIARVLVSVDGLMDGANLGHNPAGLDRDAVLFDIDPLQVRGNPSNRKSHFEQVFGRAVAAAQNALAAHGLAAGANSKLRKLADDTRSLQVDALRQDIDYRNRLIEIFGRPYDGTVGTGQPFPEGYTGPDTLLYLYIDRNETADLLPGESARFGEFQKIHNGRRKDFKSVDFDQEFFRERLHYDKGDGSDTIEDIFDDYFLTDTPDVDLDADITLAVGRTAEHAFVADESWGRRTAYGRVQVLLEEMLLEEIATDRAIADYRNHGEKIEVLIRRLQDQLRSQLFRQGARFDISVTNKTIVSTTALVLGLGLYADWASKKAEKAAEAAVDGLPTVSGPFAFDPSFLVRYGIGLAGTETGSWLRWAFQNSKIALEALKVLTEKLNDQKDARIELTNEFLELAAVVQELKLATLGEEDKRYAIAGHLQALEMKSQALQSAVAEGFRLLEEREAFNQVIAAGAQRNRYPDMVFRLARNEALTRYQDAFDHAVRYAWLAAKAFDYETGLPEGHPAAATSLLESIVKVRQLGLWAAGEPRVGQGGLAAALATLKANFDALEGQLGINNPQLESGIVSLRQGHFRIKKGAGFSSDRRWSEALQARRVDDLWAVPEFRRYCRPPQAEADGALPGLVVEFPTAIVFGQNLFGRPLGSGDHAYSAAHFATKIASAGVFFEGYGSAGLAAAPRVYLVPAGADVIRQSDGETTATRTWNVLEQRIPAPFVLNELHLTDPGFIPSLQAADGSFAQPRRFGDLRAHPAPTTSTTTATTATTATIPDPARLNTDTRLLGRSVWNTRWILIIPGGTLHADPGHGLDQFVEYVTDIQIAFETYSHQGL